VQSIAFAVPLLAGKLEADRAAMTSCAEGERQREHRDSRRHLGIRREALWIQRAPDGDLVVVYLEADDLARAFAGLAASDEPFDRWFRDHVRDVHGIDLAAGVPLPEPLIDVRVEVETPAGHARGT
jgi:hypothetical protein